jgi:hypothetical protein
MNRRILFILAFIAAVLAGLYLPIGERALLETRSTTAQATAQADYFTSPAGIVYGKDWSGKFDSRVAHIMAHTKPDPSKKKHSVFVEQSREGVLALLDEAWKKRGPPAREGGSRGRDVYDVEMGRVVGIKGERRLKLVMEKNSATIVTAYPTR